MHGEPGAVLASYISLQSHREKGKKSSCGEEDGSGGRPGRGARTEEGERGSRGMIGEEPWMEGKEGDGEKTRRGEE